MKSIGFMLPNHHFLPHAQALVHSIRANAPLLADHTIHILIPPDFNLIAPLPNVHYLTYHPSKSLPQLPYVEKILAAQTLESHLQGQGFLWMDIDSLVLANPQKLPLKPKHKIAFRTVDKRNIGIPAHQPLDPFWQTILQHFDYYPPVLLHYTTISHEKIHPYINAGFIALEEPRHLFSQTLQAIQALAQHPIIQAQLTSSLAHRIFLHQAVLTIAILKTFTAQERIHLGPHINHPLHFQHEVPIPFADLQTLRYDTYFNHTHPAEIPPQITATLPVPAQQLAMPQSPA